MPCYIIINDVPKIKVKLDLFTYPLDEDFKGFREVPPGAHYLSVKTETGYASFWCYLKPQQTIVKFFDSYTQEFQDYDLEDAAYYQELASWGAMDEELRVYKTKGSITWLLLTNDIKSSHFPVTLHPVPPLPPQDTRSTESAQAGTQSQNKSEFEKVLFDTHGGDEVAFLTEFQFAFASWFFSELDNEDIAALNRWGYLVEAVCNAGISNLAKAPTTIATLVGNLRTQLDSVDDSLLNSEEPIVSLIGDLAAELVNCDIESFVKEGQQLKSFLKQRWNLT